MAIAKIVGSAALPHLRFLAASASSLATLLCVVAVVALAGPGDPRARLVPEITQMAVELRPGVEGPQEGSSLVGQRVEVPEAGHTMLATAPVGNSYAVRFEAGDTWTGWVTLGTEIAEGPDQPATAAGDGSAEGPRQQVLALGPLRVPEGSARLEIVLLAGEDGPITLTFLTDVDTDVDTGVDPGAPAVGGIQVEAGAVARPPIMPRSSWTGDGWATDNAGCSGGPSEADRIQAVVIHHTVTTNSYQPDAVDDLLRAVHFGHVRINGWCDVGYNFLVDRFGTIWEGRSGGIDRAIIGGHAKGFNASTVGVALLGQHHPGASPSAVRPSTAAEEALAHLAAWKLSLHGVDPSGSTWLKNRSTSGPQRLAPDQWHLVPTVLGHRDLGATSCPGNFGIEVVRRLAGSLTTSRPSEVPHRYPDWAPFPNGPGFVVATSRGGLRPAGSAALPGVGEPATQDAGPQALPSPPPVAVAATGAGSATSGWVLHADGVLSAFGGAPGVVNRPAGANTAVDLAAGAAGGGWVISAQGGVHGFGGQADRPVAGTPGGPVVAGDLTGAGDGYLVDGTGALRAVGSSPTHQLAAAVAAVDVAVRPGGDSGWVLAADGRLHPFGDAPGAQISSPSGPGPGRVFRAVVASPAGIGGWIVTDDGQIWPFGNERLVLPVSTDVARADTVDLAVTGSFQPSAYLARRDTRYLTRLGELFLGRPPTAGEVDYWDGRLTYGNGDRFTVTLDLARSEAWAGARVDDLYLDVLGRAPDSAGRRYWLEQIRAGLSLRDLAVSFYGSEEYVLRSGSTEAFVERLYQAILDRSGDPTGTDYWVGLLRTGRARPLDVAGGLYQSIESRSKRVADQYQLVLGRSPDPGGHAYWAERLLRFDDVLLAAELAASDELYLTS